MPSGQAKAEGEWEKLLPKMRARNRDACLGTGGARRRRRDWTVGEGRLPEKGLRPWFQWWHGLLTSPVVIGWLKRARRQGLRLMMLLANKMLRAAV